MSDCKIAYLDLTDCKDYYDLHQRIKETFHFPDYYGRSWHAFWDAFITVGVPEKIVIRGEKTVHESLWPELEKMHEKLGEIKAKFDASGWLFEYEIVD